MLSTFGKVVVALLYGLWALWAFSARAASATATTLECASHGASLDGYHATVSGTLIASRETLSGRLNVNLFRGSKKIAEIRRIHTEGSPVLRAQNLSLHVDTDGAGFLVLADATAFGTERAQILPIACRTIR
ncbi:MAG: hypothetical protein HUU37_06260 [Bdellovibrionales bacterium]|nr:hypothetical protein [Bdellovibrionales bacterium]